MTDKIDTPVENVTDDCFYNSLLSEYQKSSALEKTLLIAGWRERLENRIMGNLSLSVNLHKKLARLREIEREIENK